MIDRRTLTFPVLNEVKRMFRKCIGKPLTDDDRAMAAQFDVAKEIEKVKAIRMENEMTVKDTAIEAYKELLSKHDKYYAYSDDGSVYRKGKVEYEKLKAIQQLIDVDKVIWNEYFKEIV